jgi:hypothetical protein
MLTYGPAHWDAELDALSRLLSRGGWQAHEVAQIERVARDRAEWVRAGVSNPTAVYWTERMRNEVEDRLRMRWDFKNGFTIDRWAAGCWQVAGVLGFNHVMVNLIEYLQERDMQRWPSPQAYLEHKRAQAQKRQFENWYKGNQKLGAVVDSMSDRRIKEFITVERAMQTGDTVVMRGATRQMFDRIAKASRNSPAPPSRSINPGQHFKVLTRKTGGKHIKS